MCVALSLPSRLHHSQSSPPLCCGLFFFTDTAPTEIYTLSLHDALPISTRRGGSIITPRPARPTVASRARIAPSRSEEHTSELQSRGHLVCRLLLEKKKELERTTTRRSRQAQASEALAYAARY